MRLTADQAKAIQQGNRRFMGERSRIIRLVGSRIDDSRRGSDVDLYAELQAEPDLAEWRRCRSTLANMLDLHIDLIVKQIGRDPPIYRIARRDGILV